MIVQDSYQFILIGLQIRFLRHVDGGILVEDVLKAEEELKIMLTRVNFRVSLASSQRDSYQSMMEKLQKMELEAPVGASHKLLNSEFEQIENTVFAEATTKRIYTLPDRRFNTDFLLLSPDRLLAAGVYESLPEVAKQDFSSACRCTLFGEATATAFHVLRCTEAVLKSYYFHHKRQNRLQRPMWGAMTAELRAKTRNRPPEPLLQSLDLIRTTYRNPTQHPEAIYQIDNAQDLFGLCMHVIGQMCSELMAAKAK